MACTGADGPRTHPGEQPVWGNRRTDDENLRTPFRDTHRTGRSPRCTSTAQASHVLLFLAHGDRAGMATPEATAPRHHGSWPRSQGASDRESPKTFLPWLLPGRRVGDSSTGETR